MKTIWIASLIMLLLIGCSGEDKLNVDTKPPVKPMLYSHQGDTGDIVGTIENPDTLNFFKIGDSVLGIENGNENNGIDAVASTLKPIQIQWGSLIDTDLSHIVIHRFNTLDTDTLAIAQISPSFNSYDDIVPFWDTDWFYSIEVFDEAGNSTLSDTVCYHLLDTPVLLSPSDEGTTTSLSDVQFQWMKQESIEIISYRLLVFDADRNLLWSFSPNDIIEGNVFTIPYAGEISTTSEIIWRVDAFGNSKDLEINGTTFTIPAGSESEERRLYIAK
jgi:hypothetical protein